MNVLHHIQKWGDEHHPAILDVLRIALGAFLLVRGYVYLLNRPFLEYAVDAMKLPAMSPSVVTVVMYYVIFVHMAGGLLICIGVYTRTASLLQLPVVFAAVFLLNIFRSPFNSELWLSVICLVFLLIFAVIGSGPLSLDRCLADDTGKRDPYDKDRTNCK